MDSLLLLSTDKDLGAALRSAVPSVNVLQWFEDDVPTSTLEQLIASAEPALILVDATNGVNLSLYLPVIREARKPFVGVIANVDKRRELFDAGMAGYLLKPFTEQEIKVCVLPYLNGKNGESKSERAQTEARDQLLSQAAQNERLIMIGRVVTGICHEITNRMQAAHGSLALALEEENLSDDLKSFLQITKQETQRVNDLMDGLRKIYRPETDKRAEINVAALVKETAALAADELRIHNLSLDTSVEDDLPNLNGQAGQLKFILLGLLLNLSGLSDAASEGVVQFQARRIGPTAQIEISTNAPLISDSDVSRLRVLLGMNLVEKVVASHEGLCGIVTNDSGITVWISVPS